MNLGRTRGQIGEYKTSRKGKYTKGDPRFGQVDLVVDGLELPAECVGIIPTFDPVYVRLGQFKEMPALVADLHKAHLLESGHPLAPVPTDVAFTMGEVFKRGWFAAAVPLGGYLAFDIETTQLEPESGSIIRISFAWRKGQGITLPWNAATRSYTQQLLGDPRRRVVGHNVVGFDVPHLAANGVEVGAQVYDTLLMAQMLEPDMPKSLNYITSLYVLMQRWKDLNSSDKEWYSLLDSERLQWAMPVIVELMEAIHVWGYYCDTIRPACQTLEAFTRLGVAVDATNLRRWQARLVRHITVLGKLWYGMHATVEIDSPQQVATMLQGVYGVKAKNADKHVINRLCMPQPHYPRGIPAARVIKRYRKVANQISKYANEKFYKEASDGGVRMYPSYVPIGKSSAGEDRVLTATGRRAAKNPPIQQFPKYVRHIVCADDGMVFFEADYSQIEAWLTAIECRDETMLELLYSGQKIHEWALGELQKVDPRITYHGAKRVVHGTNYLMGWGTLQKALHDDGVYVDAAVTKGFIAMMRAVLPGRTAWQRAVIEEARQQGFLMNAFGRRRKFYCDKYGDLEDAPVAVAFKPASNMADMMWHNLRDLPGVLAKYGGRLLGDNHDSVYGQVPYATASGALREVAETMERTWPLVTGTDWEWWCPVEVSIGRNWRDVTAIDATAGRVGPLARQTLRAAGLG